MTLASALVSNPTLFLGFVALLGLLVGSFINVIVCRLPIMLERAWQSSELPMSCLLKPSTAPFRVRTALLARSNLARVKMCPSSVSCFFADVAGTANPEYQPAILSLK